MEVLSLSDLYKKANNKARTIFVVPLIRYNLKKTDYLYLLYQDLIETKGNYSVKPISVFSHFRFVIAALFNKDHILHYHWLEFQDLRALSAMPYKLLCISLYHLLGGTIVWTVHNLTPHDRRYLNLHKRLHRWMGKKADIVHVHSVTAIPMVSEKFGIEPSKMVVLKHPDFPAEIHSTTKARERFLSFFNRSKEDIQLPVLLMFGQLSAYKGIIEAITIILSIDLPFKLWIVGPIKKGQDKLHKQTMDRCYNDERIVYIPKFIPEDRYPYLLSSADICVFNYRSILTSGGVMMARSYQRDIVAPYMGILKDYQTDSSVSLFETDEDLYNILQHKLTQLNGKS